MSKSIFSAFGLTRLALALAVLAAVPLAVVGLLASASSAQGPDASMAVTTDTVALGGSGSVTLELAPDAVAVSGAATTVTYDASIISIDSCTGLVPNTACNIDQPGEIRLGAFDATGWDAAVDLFEIGLTNTANSSGASPLTLAITELVGPDLAVLTGVAQDGAVQTVAENSVVTTTCVAEAGQVTIDIDNGGGQSAVYESTISGITQTATIAAQDSGTLTWTGLPDAVTNTTLSRDGSLIGTITTDVECFVLAEDAVVSATCSAGSGVVTLDIDNGGESSAGYFASVAGVSKTRLVPGQASGVLTWTGVPDGNLSITLYRNGAVVNTVSTVVDCVALPESASISTTCAGTVGGVTVDITNGGSASASYLAAVAGVVDSVTVAPQASGTLTWTGVPDGALSVSLLRAGAVVETLTDVVSCGPITGPAEAYAASATCLDSNGVITVDITNGGTQNALYSAMIAGAPASKTIASYDSNHLRVSGRPDGTHTIDLLRDGSQVDTLTVVVDCDPSMPAAGGVYPTVTCLAGNGRIDINVVNGGADATYSLTVGALSSRTRLVASGDWWRSPVTGRPDGPIAVTLTRDGATVLSTDLMVQCDTPPTAFAQDEIQLLNVCRASGGFVAWQFANPTPATRGYIVIFESVANRSTTAAAYGASVRGVSSRPNGDYAARILADGVEIWAETVTVNC